ncbi:MAG: glycosyltransferase family 2 protein [Acidimicrobiia bacterium]
MTDAAGAAAPRWAAVVVNYESGPLLAECVAALVAEDSAGPVEIVVVDNGSADGSAAAVRTRFPAVTVIDPHANLGYARAANLGIAATRAPIVGVLNSDTVVQHGAGRAVLDAFAADDAVAVVGPRIVNPDGSTYPSARNDPAPVAAVGHAVLGRVAPWNRFTRDYRQLDADPGVARDVDWVSGAALWFRRSALDAAGGWDERFFMFLEDVDVCRAVAAAGGRIRYEPAARVMHVVGASRARQPVRMVLAHHRSAYRYAAKWWTGPRRAALPAAAGLLSVRAGVGALGAVLHRPRRSGRPEIRAGTG